MWLAHDWVVSWSVVNAWSWEDLLNVREIERRCITAVCWNSFSGLVVKTVGSYFVSRFGRQNRNSGGKRCWVYRRCRFYRREIFVWRDVLNLLERKRFVVARVELGERREKSLTRRECDLWHKETVTSSQPVLLPGELGSSRQLVRLGVHLLSRLLTWQTTDLPEGHVLRRIFVSIIRLFCNVRGNFDL